MTTLERKQLLDSVLPLIEDLIEKAPDDAFPMFVSKGMAKKWARGFVMKLSTKDLLDEMILAYTGLDKIFQSVSKDWMLERAGAIKQSRFEETRRALRESGIAFLFD